MQELDHQHIRRISRYLSNVNGLYSNVIKEVALATIGVKKTNKLFRFKDYKRITESVDKSLANYENRLVQVIHGYSKKEWDFANAKVDQLVNEQLKPFKGKIAKHNENYQAFEKFKSRKIKGITVVDRVAAITKRMRTNLEVAADVSLEDGLTATQLANRMKSELADINKLLRKVKTKHGSVVFSDVQNSFIVGRGNYKSANKSALRLVANELTDAYRESENIRIKDNNDIVGTKISVSKSHVVRDICDDLAGKYPKDYSWNKWHIGCKCIRTYIFKTPKELENEIRNDQNLSPDSSKNFVSDAPSNYYNWIKNNEAKLKNSPNFIANNKKYNADVSILMDKAQKSSNEMTTMINSILGEYGGYATPLNYKSRDSIFRKVTTELNGEVSEVKDAVRATIILPIKNYKNLADNLEKSGIFERVKYQEPGKFSGYSGIITNFKTSNGITAEIQFNTEKMIYAKEKPTDAIRIMGEKRWREIEKETGLKGGLGHEFYEQMRILDKTNPRRLELEKQSNEYYKNFR